MRYLDRRYGPWSGRVWGLIVNFAANAAALYGAAGVLRDGSRLPLLIVGAAVTAACVTLLAAPNRAAAAGDGSPPRGRAYTLPSSFESGES